MAAQILCRNFSESEIRSKIDPEILEYFEITPTPDLGGGCLVSYRDCVLTDEDGNPDRTGALDEAVMAQCQQNLQAIADDDAAIEREKSSPPPSPDDDAA